MTPAPSSLEGSFKGDDIRADGILRVCDDPFDDVEVPTFGGGVEIRKNRSNSRSKDGSWLKPIVEASVVKPLQHAEMAAPRGGCPKFRQCFVELLSKTMTAVLVLCVIARIVAQLSLFT
jgi:hypothetical protein